ncbi:MAG: FtsX-like permease family protein [Vicinamibacterales bacterium]
MDVWTVLDESSFGATDPQAHLLTVVGRLKSGVSIQDARVDGADVTPYSPIDPSARGRVTSISILLVSAAALVLLIACANVVGLLLSLASSRTHQLAVRVALGASRRQLRRQLLADAVVLAAGGGALGWLLASWTSHIVPALLFAEDAERLHFFPSVMALVLAAILGVAVMVVSSLAPMVSAPLANPTTVMRRSDEQVTTGGRRARAALVVVQMALSGLLLTSSGLLLIDVRKALEADLGDRLDTVAVETAQASAGYRRPSDGIEYFEAAQNAVGKLPDVLGTAWIGTPPAGRPGQSTYRIEQRHAAWQDVLIDTVTFAPEGLPADRLLPAAGRMFGGQDTPGGCRVAMVDQETADQLFDGDPVGRSIEDATGRRVDIIGILRGPRRPDVPTRRLTLFVYAPQSMGRSDATGPLLYHVPVAETRRPVTMLSNVATGSYFAMFGVAPIAGRTFTLDDDSEACGVAVVNQEDADRYFGGHAVGGGLIDEDGRRLEIVGVVPSGAFKTLAPPAEPMVYQPPSQHYVERMTMVARTAAATPSVLTAITKNLQAVKGGSPLDRAQSLATYFGRTTLASERITTMLVAVCGTLALCLSLLGVYSVLSDSVARRTREFGLRVALGARAWHIIGPLVALGVRLALAGAACGALAAFLLHRWFDPFSRTASPVGASALVWIGAPTVLLVIGVAGSILPARRAVGVDPLVLMRDRP